MAACPGWDVGALVDHLGGIHQWCRAAVLSADPDGGAPDLRPEPAPEGLGRDAVLAWYSRHAGAMVAALTRAGPDAPAWGFGGRPRTTAFWWRRQVHETLLHCWDLRAALGPPPPAVVCEDPVLALDGIDEVVTMFYPRQVRIGRCDPLTQAVRLVPTAVPDHPGWLLAGDGTGPVDDPALVADAVLRGPADLLLLALWHRIRPDDERLEVAGDPAG